MEGAESVRLCSPSTATFPRPRCMSLEISRHSGGGWSPPSLLQPRPAVGNAASTGRAQSGHGAAWAAAEDTEQSLGVWGTSHVAESLFDQLCKGTVYIQ